MVNNVLLDNVTHKDLKIVTKRGPVYGDDVRYTLVVPREFRQAQAQYPIVFRKNSSTGQFEAAALFGFNEKENLFLGQSEWKGYIPYSIERIPFVIGYARDRSSGEQQPVIHVDMDHPRVSFGEGERVFLEHGGNSTYLDRINSILSELLIGVEESQDFFNLLLSVDLIEAFTLRIQLSDNSGLELTGFYTINEEKLQTLNAEMLAKLHAKGHLENIYMVIASMSNIRQMIEMKEALL